MNLLYTILTVSMAVSCFWLGLVVLMRNVGKNLNYMFFIFTWFITIWGLISYAFFLDQSNFLLYKLAYAFGGVCILTTAPWVLYLIKDKPNNFLVGLFYVLGGMLITVPFWDQSVITNFAIKNNVYTFSLGFSYYIYSSIVFLTAIYLFYLLIKSAISSTGKRQYQIIFVLTGLSIYFFGELLFGLIFPLLNITPSAPFDNLAAISFVGFASYGLLKLN